MILVSAIAATLGVGVAGAAAADNLSLHDKHAIEIRLYSASCADCDSAPNMKTAVWRFASSFATGGNVTGFAYTLVTYRQVDGDRQAVLLGFEPYAGRWRILAKSASGRNEFSCGTNVLLNKNYALDRQLRLVKKLVRCL